MNDATILHDAAITQLAAALASRARRGRLIVGIAGIPGAGKSTLARRIVTTVGPTAVAVPMDGFHLRTAELRERDLLDRKGAPETFDVAGYFALLRRCRQGGQAERFPVYDRTLHEPSVRDTPECTVAEHTRLIVTEGNYLLLAREPWTELGELLDETWLLDAPAEQARLRLLQRHQRGGRSAAEAERRCAFDKLNAELVRTCARAADRVVRWP